MLRHKCHQELPRIENGNGLIRNWMGGQTAQNELYGSEEHVLVV